MEESEKYYTLLQNVCVILDSSHGKMKIIYDRNEDIFLENTDYRNGLRDGLLLHWGIFAVAFTFGMASVANGLGILQAVLISLTNVTSAGQFSGLEIIATNGSYIEIALTQLIINLRYSLMSFSWHRS